MSKETHLKKTYEHIKSVQNNLLTCINDLQNRLINHDASKMNEPELSGFANAQGKLSKAEYGTDEYSKLLEELKPIIQEHYKANTHHPEHYKNGIEDMDLLDILEMVCDWKSASERTKDGSIEKSLEVNAKRFDINPTLLKIIRKTIYKL